MFLQSPASFVRNNYCSLVSVDCNNRKVSAESFDTIHVCLVNRFLHLVNRNTGIPENFCPGASLNHFESCFFSHLLFRCCLYSAGNKASEPHSKESIALLYNLHIIIYCNSYKIVNYFKNILNLFEIIYISAQHKYFYMLRTNSLLFKAGMLDRFPPESRSVA